MTINLIGSQFTLDTGFYYSPSFVQDSDEYVSIAIWTGSSATISMQQSIDNSNWIDIDRTSFTCNTSALQSFEDCHLGIYYRVKSSVLPTKCQILI